MHAARKKDPARLLDACEYGTSNSTPNPAATPLATANITPGNNVNACIARTGTNTSHARQVWLAFRNNKGIKITQTDSGNRLHARLQLTVTGVPSRGPRLPISSDPTILSSPNVVTGTRHEYEQVPPHPYSNEPDATLSVLR